MVLENGSELGAKIQGGKGMNDSGVCSKIGNGAAGLPETLPGVLGQREGAWSGAAMRIPVGGLGVERGPLFTDAFGRPEEG